MTSTVPSHMFKEILTELKINSGIYASAIVLKDGLIVASDMPSDINEEALAAMTATMLKAAETVFTELNKGDIERIIIEGTHAKIIAAAANKDFVLVSMAEPKSTLGLILHNMNKAIEKLNQIT